MYKAIKDNKIIAINETDSFPLLVYDEIIEDKIYQVEDYIEYNGEYVLKSQNPEPLQQKGRAVRDQYINDIEWRVSRYRDQKELDVPTTDTEETYIKILQYMQYLRDYPESGETWYEQNPLTFDEWNK